MGTLTEFAFEILYYSIYFLHTLETKTSKTPAVE